MNENESIYKQAVRMKMRVHCRQGVASVEYLFELPLKELDEIYSKLSAKQQAKGNSLLGERTRNDDELELKMAIVKDVFETRQAEIREAEQTAERAAQKARLMQILREKREGALQELSEEELLERIEELS